jgi:tetratricopeptide (TPR) repeat protein
MIIKLKVESLKLKGLFLTVILFFNLNAFAQSDFDLANAAYADGRYEEAAAGYQALLEEEPSATLYYNLGNACFKQGELSQAILNYERALRLQPNHKDAQHNLKFAESLLPIIL